ncbi:MAG: DUF2911 domain-containing protein [Gemmatimonadales bacterium]
MRVRHIMLAGALCCPVTLAAQRHVAETGFLWRLGTDTTQIERVRSDGPRMQGVHLTRVPATTVREWSAELGPDGSVRHFEQIVRRGRSIVSRRRMAFTGDSVTQTLVRGDSTSDTTVAAPAGTLPDLPNSYAFLELALRRLSGRDSADYWLLPPGGDAVERAVLVRGRGDTVLLRLEGLPPITLRVESTGRIVWANNLGTVVTRVPAPDMDALAAGFASRPLGSLSPRDTARAAIGGTQVFVDYGRPARRGRVIFGGLVPWNEVWRTGANRTTTLVTDGDVVVGDVTLAAGSYALFTIPTPAGWTLIINRNVGSGLDYDEGQDVARVPMRAERVPQGVDRFTIALEPRGAHALLSFTWEHTRAAVAVRRR